MLLKFFGVDPNKRFWKWFEDHLTALAAVRSGNDPVLQKISQELRKVHPNLDFEMGLSDDGQLEFIVSANGIKSVFPAVEQLVACAPRLPNWKIIAFRQPKDSVSEILYENFLLKAEDVWFSHKHRMDKVDLTIFIRDLSPDNAEQAIGASFILLDSALGEYLVATGIGFIEHKPLPDHPDLRGFQPWSKIQTVLTKKLTKTSFIDPMPSFKSRKLAVLMDMAGCLNRCRLRQSGVVSPRPRTSTRGMMVVEYHEVRIDTHQRVTPAVESRSKSAYCADY